MSIWSTIAKSLAGAYAASKGVSSASSKKRKSSKSSSSSTTTPTTPTPSSPSTPVADPRNVGVRDYFEGQGYKVEYNDNTGNIRVYDPKTGYSADVTKGFYDTRDGRSYVSPDMSKRVEDTIRSGQYQLPGYGYSSDNTSAVRAQSDRGKSYSPYEVIDTATKIMGPLAGSMLPGYVAGPTAATTDQAAKLGGAILGETIDSRTGGYYQQPYPEYDQMLFDMPNYYDSIRYDFGYDIDTAPIYKKHLDQALETITQYENQLMEMLKQQMGGVDPATQAALASLKENIQRQRDGLMEEMSRRGLLQSGLWLEMEDRLGKGELTAQQQLLAGRLGDLQNQMNQALQNFAGMRLNVSQTYGIEGARAAEREAMMRRESMERQLQRELDEAYRKQSLAMQQFQTYAPYMYLTESQRQSMPMEWANIMGQIPQGPGYEPIPARNYVGDSNIDYDNKTGEVIVNGQRINPSAAGGYIQNGTAYIPKNILDRMLYGSGGR